MFTALTVRWQLCHACRELTVEHLSTELSTSMTESCWSAGLSDPSLQLRLEAQRFWHSELPEGLLDRVLALLGHLAPGYGSLV